VKRNGKKPSNQDEEDQGPFQIMDARIMNIQFTIDNTFDENSTPTNHAEPCGNVPKYYPPNRSRFKGGKIKRESQGRDENPKVPENDEVETYME
jgi:hypothetical protein